MRLPRPEPRKGRIEIIPMIDAIFFLLVYFIMISLTMVRMDTHGVARPVSLTASQHVKEHVVISTTRKGEIFLDKDTVTEAELYTRIKTRLAADPSLTIVLNCDKDRRVDLFLRVFDLVKRANARNVVIATTPPIPGGNAR